MIPLCNLDSTRQYLESPSKREVSLPPIKENPTESYWNKPNNPELAIEIEKGHAEYFW